MPVEPITMLRFAAFGLLCDRDNYRRSSPGIVNWLTFGGNFFAVVARPTRKLADQLKKRGIFSRRVRETALAIIDDRKDAAAIQALGMKPAIFASVAASDA
jgi:hypothetical protein